MHTLARSDRSVVVSTDLIREVRLLALAAATLLFCSSGWGQTEPLKPPTKTWKANFIGDQVVETVTLIEGDIFLTEESSAPILIGTVRGQNLGELGIMAANFDGNESGRQSLAYFDPDHSVWNWGVIENRAIRWTPVGEYVNGMTRFYLGGNGPTMFPVDQLAKSPMDYQQALAEQKDSTRAAIGTLAPLNYPVEGSQYTVLARSKRMWTHFFMNSNGSVWATTRVKEDTLFAGFHGKPSIHLFSPYDLQNALWTLQGPSIGVTGVFWGHSDVSASWTQQAPPEILERARYYAVLQKWEPDWFATMRDLKKLAEALRDIVQPLKEVFPLGK